jgi:hypothetical protein
MIQGLRHEYFDLTPRSVPADSPDWNGWWLSEYKTRIWYGDKLVAYEEVNFDAFGRRSVPQTKRASRKLHTVFMGGSIVFGDGLKDAETLPAAYSRVDDQSHVYNYGISGGGPNQFARQFEVGAYLRPQAVPQRSGTLYYVFYDAYFGRVDNSVSLFRSWGGRKLMPSYRVRDDGKVEFEGDFRTAHPWRTKFYGLLANSALFQSLKIDYPIFPSDQTLAKAAALIQHTKELYLREFPNGRFVVVLFPERSKASALWLLPLLEEHGIETLDYSSNKRFSDKRKGYWTGEHIHPTGKMNQEFAQLLYEDAQRYKSKKVERANPYLSIRH